MKVDIFGGTFQELCA